MCLNGSFHPSLNYDHMNPLSFKLCGVVQYLMSSSST